MISGKLGRVYKMTAINLLLYLVGAHLVADYPLQGSYLASMKNYHNSADWYLYLGSHAMIQAFLAVLVLRLFNCSTKAQLLTWLLVGVSHFGIDYLKCAGITDIFADQSLHLIILCVIALISGRIKYISQGT